VIGDPHVTVHDLNCDGRPYPSQRFECVVGSGILEYIDDVPRLLRQIYESLQPGGSAVLTYYNMYHYSRRIARYRGRVPWRHPDFRNSYTAGEMLGEIHTAGFGRVRETADVMAFSRFKVPALHGWVPGRRTFGRNLVYVARRP
jgi:SAM-dependent methyltransferase